MADYYIQDKTAEISKRVNDAFTELDTQRCRMNELTEWNAELRNELIKLQKVQKHRLVVSRILLAITGLLWVAQIIYNLCILT